MKKPIRVAHIMGKMLGGGVEAVVMNYYRNIDHSRVQFDFIVDSDSTRVPRDEIKSLGGRVFEVPPYQSLLAYRKSLLELYRHEQWSIVHSHINALSVIPLQVAKKAGVPVRIAHSHSAAGKGEHARNAMKAVLRRFSNIYPTHRFACSRHAGDWLFGQSAPYELMYNAIELDNFFFNPDARINMRANLGLSDSEYVIGHVGRFVQTKNQGFLIDAFEDTLSRRADCVLCFVGTGKDENAVKNMVAERKLNDRVLFLGQREDVNCLYQAFDMFVLPSLYEGLGLAGIEAQAAGLPCIFSNRITKEANLTGECQYLPINCAKTWAIALATQNKRSDLQRTEINRTAFLHYDITTQSARLTERYLELYKGTR